MFDLIAIDHLFVDLIGHPVADRIVTDLLGPDYIVSNFTANIARPGSGSMGVHSDTALVLPEPWLSPVSMNVIWCLTDVHAGQRRDAAHARQPPLRALANVPTDPMATMVPFEAPAGSIMVMEGRVWHTSGANVTADQDRALLFGYYTKPYIRPQWNFTAALTPEQQAAMSPVMRYRLGLDIVLNSDASKVLTASTGLSCAPRSLRRAERRQRSRPSRAAYVTPPSQGIATPLMKPAAGEARNAARAPMSSGSPRRPTGVRATKWSRRCPGIERTSGVAIRPGRMALAVTPPGPNSWATAWVKPMTPAFDAAYAGWPRPGRIAAIEERLITLPQPRSAIPGAVARTVWNMPDRLTRPRGPRHRASSPRSARCCSRCRRC